MNDLKLTPLNSDNPNPPLTMFGELSVARNLPKAAWRFDYGVNTKLCTTTSANGGGVTASGSKAILSTSTAVNGSASLATKRVLRYTPGIGGLVRFTAHFTTGRANSTQIIGLGGVNDGLFIGYNGTSFGVMRRRGGSDTWVAQSAFNGDSVSFDPTKGNVYSIGYQWLGFGVICFYVLDPGAFDQSQLVMWRLLHMIKYPNTSTDVFVLNPTFPIYASVSNSGNNTNMTLSTPSAVAFLQGGREQTFNPLDVTYAYDNEVTLATTNNTQIITIHNKTTINGVENRVPIELHELNVGRSSAGASLSTIRIYRNATFGSALTYADVDANNSPVEGSATSTTISTGTVERSYVVSDGTTTFAIAFDRGEIILYPDEYLTISIQNSQSTSTILRVTIDWIEQF